MRATAFVARPMQAIGHLAKKHAYPGVDLPLRHFPQRSGYGTEGQTFFRIGAHRICQGSTSPMLQLREVAMLILMDRLTDKPNWHQKVFDNNIVAKWRHEALTQSEEALFLAATTGKDREHDELRMPRRRRIISESCFDYAIAELRCKAAFYNKTGLVLTLNSGRNIITKSDTLVPSSLANSLKDAFAKLRAEQGRTPDWHPGSNGMVRDLVHPSLYPFVYGRSKFIEEEAVGVSDTLEWAGRGHGQTVPKDGRPPEGKNQGGRFWAEEFIPSSFWSETYQWLPANLAFDEGGSVKFTSYVNNLHPKKYPEIYKAIEQLIDISIPAWDHVLHGYTSSIGGMGRFLLPSQSRFGNIPYERDDFGVWEALDDKFMEQYELENGPIVLPDYVKRDVEAIYYGEPEAVIEAEMHKAKWAEIRDFLYPEPEAFFPVEYECRKSIRDRFRDTGLQVIVKMASIELTPEKPDFPPGGWHVEGQMNERIVATALYYLDSDNVTPSHLSFRMQTDSDNGVQRDCGGQESWYYQQVFGTPLRDFAMGNAPAIQNYGSVETRQGRLLAFPNVFQHAVSGFSLKDRTKPGHRRFIALWLVDPHQRIISTANVPPQQLDWWEEAVAAKAEATDTTTAAVEDNTSSTGSVPEGLVTRQEAMEHRLQLMKERSRFQDETDNSWHSEGYSFCEH